MTVWTVLEGIPGISQLCVPLPGTGVAAGRNYRAEGEGGDPRASLLRRRSVDRKSAVGAAQVVELV